METEVIGLIKRSVLAKRLGVDATTLDRWCKKLTDFPKPVKIVQGVWFKVDEVNAFIEKNYDIKGKAIAYSEEMRRLRALEVKGKRVSGKRSRRDALRCQ